MGEYLLTNDIRLEVIDYDRAENSRIFSNSKCFQYCLYIGQLCQELQVLALRAPSSSLTQEHNQFQSNQTSEFIKLLLTVRVRDNYWTMAARGRLADGTLRQNPNKKGRQDFLVGLNGQ